jgi:hypothetical protein
VHRKRNLSQRNGERGVVILLVAIVLLFVVGAMAVLAIDVVTFYTARSEAQLAADGAALAAARVLANSGMTSHPADTNLVLDATNLATSIATQLATGNKVGGRNLTAGTEVTVSFPNQASPLFGSNPQVKVQVTRSDLPTFFARIWGTTQVTVTATATAEAYNPSGLNLNAGAAPPVAPTCVKPWVLPNLSPTGTTLEIFDAATGAIKDPTLLGWQDAASPALFHARCGGGCNPWSNQTPVSWQYYPGSSTTTFKPPNQAQPTCNVALNAYQESIAGCVPTPIACGAGVTSNVDLDQANHFGRNSQTAHAVNCLTHSENGNGDQVEDAPPNQSFQFLGGNDNPIVNAAGKNVLISDSLVTVPVYNSSGSAPASSVPVIGFVQLFLNPDGQPAPTGLPNPGRIKTTIVNLVGCGTNATGQPILGNGGSAIPVRLLSP